MHLSKTALKETIKLKILRMALKLVEKGGWDNMTVRKISEKINYSTIKIYNEFGNKDGLVLELQKLGFNELKSTVQEAAARTDDPHERLRNVSLAIWDFAQEHPHFFQLAFGMNGAPVYENRDKHNHEMGYALWQPIEEALPKSTQSLMYSWWAMVYGHILVDAFSFFGKAELRAHFEKSVARFIKGME